MQHFTNKFAAWAAVATLGAAGLLTVNAEAAGRGQGRMANVMAQLNLTDAQKAQTRSIFQESHQAAKPIRQQLKQTRLQLRAAVKAGDTNQIQQLSAAEGTQRGQLSAIHSTAFSKVYQTLTPDQQQKLTSLQQSMRGHRRAPAAAVQN